MAWGDDDPEVGWGVNDPDASTLRGSKPVAKGPPKSAPRKQSGWDEVSGFMANVNRGLGIGDELAAVAPTIAKSVQDIGAGKAPDVVANFKGAMANQRAVEDDFMQRRPLTANFAKGTGMAGTVFVPSAPAAQTLANAPRLGNMARGAVTAGATGAAYALADRGTVEERLNAGSKAARDPLTLGLGAAGGSLVGRKAGPPKNAPRKSSDVLKEIGVQTTLPQRLGGIAKQTEDLAMRAPILGPAVSGTRTRQVEQLNRGIGLKALEPIGGTIPKEIKPGFEMVEYVDDALGDVYEQAAARVPRASADGDFMADLATIAERRADLADNEVAQFDKIVESRLARLARDDADGALVKSIHGELGKLQREFNRKGQETLSSMIGDTRRALMGIVQRADPEAGEMISRADDGWRIYSIMNDAAAAASNRGGVFLPGQLNTQNRMAARGMGSNMAGKGKGPLQDIVTAASQTLPDQFGNPGTANAIGLGGLGVGVMTEPATTALVATGLTGAAAPYWMAARKVIETLPANASRSQVAKADAELAELAAKDPAIAKLRAQLAEYFARGAGVVRGQAPMEVDVTASTHPDHLAWQASR